MNKYYILRKNNYYLSDIMVEDGKLVNFAIDIDYRKLYSDFDLAHEDQKLIFIETGWNLEVERFKEVKDEILSINE